MDEEEAALVAEADRRATDYLRGIEQRRVYPDPRALDGLGRFEELLPDRGRPGAETLALLDDAGSPATVATNGPRYFGFVVGASLPVAAAAERLMLAWDQGAALAMTSPAAARIEQVAAEWLLDILDLPRGSAVGFGTSATACSLTLLTAARDRLLANAGRDVATRGAFGAPPIRVVVPETVHVTILKALRVLGFGTEQLVRVATDAQGRIDPTALPPLDARTLLILQAGEVNTGEFDRFAEIIPLAKAAGAWVHVDGAFGLWARASAHRARTDGIEGADSWTVDGHKWLNTPYDCAMAICRDPEALARAMNSDAAYAEGSRHAQKNLTLEFSRRARGIPVWATLRTLGRDGVAAMVERHVAQAQWLAERLRGEGFEVLNRVVLNQLVVRGRDDAETAAIRLGAERSGEVWFGPTVWQGRPAFRLSLSSWRTEDSDVVQLADLLIRVRAQIRG
jgi:glutamate/tyrosine decarboxylase-like PLP-dependent enzyme